MTFEELEELIRKYLSAGIVAVVVIVAPGTAPDGTAADPEIHIIEPEGGVPSGSPGPRTNPPVEEDETDPGGGSGSGADRDSAPATSSAPATGSGTGPDGDPGSGSGRGSDEPEHPEPTAPPRAPEPESDRPGSSPRDTVDEEAGGSDRPSGTAPDSGPAAADGQDTDTESTTAAEVHGWGAPDREDDFSGGTEQWSVYDGPGHSGEGVRSRSAISIENGILTITGDSAGTTAGMAWNPGQRYGRWEGRVRAPASDPSYNALLLLWPDAENFPVGGEIDFMEMLDHTRQTTDIFIHYGADNSQVNGQVEIDGTEWHNWAVEWTPESITAYVDGEEWYSTTDTSVFPPGPMHLCVQLDWFPEGATPQESYLLVDWVRQYSLDEPPGAATPSGSGDGRADPGGDEQEDPMARIREAFRRLFSGG